MQLDSDGLERMRRVLRHRLLNFVSGIKSANTLLSSELDDRLTAREREYFPMIQRECDQIAAMVNRFESLFVPLPAPISVKLDDAMQSILLNLRELHPLAEIILNVDSNVYKVKPQVCCEALKLSIIETVTNSYESSRMPVVISIVDNETSCMIRVIDEGTPMSAEIREMAFEPFYTTRARHVGIGLSLAKRLIEDRGGAISISPDKNGNCVEIVLPYMRGVNQGAE
ncbi:MAG: HAMP domain-containing histidine kinase [Pontiellaceae bacterium]|nr:HAMP domain-containing histidine kinase [Pontiellaceae bacterium]